MERDDKRFSRGAAGERRLQEISKDSLDSLSMQVKKFKSDINTLKSRYKIFLQNQLNFIIDSFFNLDR